MTKKRIFLKEPSDYNPNKQEKREQDDLFYNDINEYSSILKKALIMYNKYSNYIGATT